MPSLPFSDGFVVESELLSFLFGLLSVAMLARGDGRGWPVGVANIALSGWVFWKTGLFGSALLQLYYFPTQLIGWYRWSEQDNDDLRRSRRFLSAQERLGMALGWLLATYLGGRMLAHGGGVHPELDAFVTVGSLLGQTLIVWGYVEAWPVYLAVDVVSVLLYFQAKLYFYAVMFLIFCGLAAQGWWKWTRESPAPKRNDPRP